MNNVKNLIKPEEISKPAPMIVQILLLALICFIGEVLSAIIPMNISATVYDFVLVYLLLQFKVIKIEWIEKISNILAGCMLLSFVPGTVNIVNAVDDLLQMVFPAVIASTIGAVLVLLVSGYTVQGIMMIIKKLKTKKGDVK